jgi:hypothetical protein
MSHMLPPDNERDSTPKKKSKKARGTSGTEVFTIMAVVVAFIVLVVVAMEVLNLKGPSTGSPYDNTGNGQLGNGQSLGGAMGGQMDEEVPTPESLSREIRGGGARVLISSPSGDRVIQIPAGSKTISKPVGGDTTEATPVGGAGSGE